MSEFESKKDLDAALLASAETASTEAAAKRAASAAERALDEIAALLGVPSWEYPGQVVRDVRELRDVLVACRPFIFRAQHRSRPHQQDREDAKALLPRIESLVGRYHGDTRRGRG